MESGTHMDEYEWKLVPDWFKEAKKGQYSIMVGDDIDSLATASLLKQYMDWDINWFYNFREIFVADESVHKSKRVGVDMALEMNEKTIDNHLTLLHRDDEPNSNSVNMNAMNRISRDNYSEKYAMSTLLLAWSLLGIPLPESDEGKKILLAIDSSYMGHYNIKYRDTHDRWLRRLGFEELIYFMDHETNPDELHEVIKIRYNLNGKVEISKQGKLYTNIKFEEIGKELELDIKISNKNFKSVYKLKRGNKQLGNDDSWERYDKTYSFALTYQNNASFTTL